MNSAKHLNLTRKWRSKNFDQIIGQNLVIKMLKNSLYLGQFFPVYLFSGQRGCGKTTTARVFAAAINCEQLAYFQKNPKSASIPCLTCLSCTTMMQGQHPDFFEIDAASHTGVDTIRQIIDASQLLPLMGSKKIYLIDEAHMLSKASFNALLKILEEPPRSVLFILATTDDQKIIDTVKSRCFQLFFRPIAVETLLSHLVQVCQTEKIAADSEGLRLIIQESDGSARDAINLLEQVRFATGKVNKESVLRVLGHLDDEHFVTLLEITLYKTPSTLLLFLQKIEFERYSAEFIWKRFIELVRAAMWIKYNVEPIHFMYHKARIESIMRTCPWKSLHALLHALTTHEAAFIKSTNKHALLEMILLQLCQKNTHNDDATGMPTLPHNSSNSTHHNDVCDDEQEDTEESDTQAGNHQSLTVLWQQFLLNIETLNDPLLLSIFQQGIVQSWDASQCVLNVEFSKELSFFKDSLSDSEHQWKPFLQSSFGQGVIFKELFTGATKATKQLAKHEDSRAKNQLSPADVPPLKTSSLSYTRKDSIGTNTKTMFDVSDTTKWPKANILLHYFPGTIHVLQEAEL